MTEAQKNTTDLLATEFANTSMRLFVNITPQVRQVMDRLDDVTAAMRAEASVQVDKIMTDAKDAPWMASQIWTVAALEVAQVGKRKVLEIIRERENSNEN